MYKSTAGNISGEAARGSGAGHRKSMKRSWRRRRADEPTEAAHAELLRGHPRARSYKLLNAEIEIGARSAAFCHLANIAYRVGPTLKVDPKSGQFVGNAKANELWTRKYRSPYTIPENV